MSVYRRLISSPAILYWLALLGVALTLGPADDEAYYWAIALPFKWGFAYHPPGVLWLIGALRFWLGDGAGIWALRLPTLLLAWGSWRLALRLIPAAQRGAAGVLLLTSLPAFWGAAWMAVPDWGLVFFTTLLMVAVLEQDLEERRALALAAVGACGVMLFKLSGVLAVDSARLAAFALRGKLRWRFWGALILGAAVGFLPFVIWNTAHDWIALRYQVSERHGGLGGFEGFGAVVRWSRFALVTAFLVGPAALYAVSVHVRARAWNWLVWILPPLVVFGLQPLWGEFKPHWIWIAFWPAVIGVLAQSGRDLRARVWLKRMSGYGVGLILIVWILLSLPFVSWLSGDPLRDPGADFAGYEQVPAFLEAHGVAGLPVVAGRYQVVGQLTFALRGAETLVTEYPVDTKERADWPSLEQRASGAFVYFADQRYSQGPDSAWKCHELGTILPRRPLLWAAPVPGKWIRAWRCAL